MNKIKTSKQAEDLYNSVISENLIYHTCQFFEETKNGMKPFGSGVLVVVNNIHYIFTAAHVAKILEKQNFNLFINVFEDGYINVVGRVKYTNLDQRPGIDLAYIKLDGQIISLLIKHYKFLPVNKIRIHNQLLEGGANYCVLGFPENQFSYADGELTTYPQAYFTLPTIDKAYEYYGLNKAYWIIVTMTGKSQDVTTKEKSPMDTHFYGLSGCGLWLMMPNMEENSCDYRLIGIMTDFKKGKYFCLIGNKIKFLIEALSTFEKINLSVKIAK